MAEVLPDSTVVRHLQLSPARARTLFSTLSPQQKRVAWRLALGQRREYIARALGIAEKTVDIHMTDLRRKLHVPTAAVPILTFLAFGLNWPAEEDGPPEPAEGGA